MISKFALDCHQYTVRDTEVTWRDSDLRQWLNNSFLHSAFSTEENAIIHMATVPTAIYKNTFREPNFVDDTQDLIFILSDSESDMYFSSDNERMCEPTDYAVAKGAFQSDNGNCWWWLRSPVDHDLNRILVPSVLVSGYVHESSVSVDSLSGAVRPAMWISLEG